MGALLTFLGLVIVFIIGSPLLIPKLWRVWSKNWWFSILLLFVFIGLLAFSWHPNARILVLHPELKEYIENPNPTMALCGWLGIMFSLAWCPLISF
jgi:hypothetical protein